MGLQIVGFDVVWTICHLMSRIPLMMIVQIMPIISPAGDLEAAISAVWSSVAADRGRGEWQSLRCSRGTRQVPSTVLPRQPRPAPGRWRPRLLLFSPPLGEKIRWGQEARVESRSHPPPPENEGAQGEEKWIRKMKQRSFLICTRCPNSRRCSKIKLHPIFPPMQCRSVGPKGCLPLIVVR